MASVFQPEEPVPDQQSLTNEWTAWMQQPSNKAAVLQFGLNLMSPISTNQSGAGHVAAAIGGGAEAAGRSQEAMESSENEQAKLENLERRTAIAEKREGRIAAQAGTGKPVSPTSIYNTEQRNQRDQRAFIGRLARDAAAREAAAAKAAANEIPPRTIPARSAMDFIADPGFLSQAQKTWATLDPSTRSLMLEASGAQPDPMQEDDTEAVIDETQGRAANVPTIQPGPLPPPRALRSLQEGTPTTFQNGETWTLRNGRPVRLR